MKLIKLLYKFDTPLKEDVKAFFPRDLEETLKANYILVSDAKFRLLEFAKVGMYVYHTFSETEADDMEALFGLREDYIIIKNVVDPAEFDIDTFDPSTYNLNDYIFFYKEAPVAPEKPVAPKFHSGTFNYELTETEKKILWDAYLAKEEEYKALYEAYEEEYATFKEEELDLPIYGCLGIITRKENDIPGTILKYYDDKKLLILLDASFKTTKDVEQFGIYGKIPNGRPTLVSADIGGLKAGTSLRTWNYKEILETVFGLEPEKEKVGTIQPEAESDKVSATVSYGEGKTAIGSLTDTATITATLKLSEQSEATTVKLMNGTEVVDTTAVADTVTFSVTGLSSTTIYKIVAVHTDSESGEEVIDAQTSVSVVVNFVAPTVTGLTATPTSVDNTSTPVTFAVTVKEGSSAITSVKLYKSDNTEVMAMALTDEETYGCVVNSITSTSGYYAKAVDANNKEVKSNTVNVTLNIVAPTVTLSADKTTVTSKSEAIVFTAIVTASKAITSVKLYKEDGTEVGTMTLDGANYTYTVNGITESTGFFAKATDEDSIEGNSAVKNITLNISEPTITLTTDKNSVTSSTDSVVFTATVTAGSGSITKVELYKSDDTKVADMVLDGSNYVYTVTGLSENTTFYAKATNSEDLFKKSANKAITVNITAPTVTLATAPTSVGNTTTPVTFTATVTNTSGTITSVELYKSDDTKVGDMTLDGSTYTYTLNTLTETTAFYAKATNSETRSGVSANKTVTLTMAGPNATLTANPASLTTVGKVTLTANVTAGSSAITQVELFDNSTATGTAIETETSGFDDLSWEIQGVDETCAYSIKVTDANGLTKTASANITFTVQNPVITMTASPTTITTKKDNVTLTITATKKSFDLTKIELFEGATATGTALETWTTDLTTAKTKTIADVNTNKTYTVKVTDSKGNTGTASASVTYNYVHPAITVTSVTPSSTDSPITPSSVVTVAVACTAQTGATGSTVKLYRNSVATANLIESKEYAASTSFSVSGGHTNGDKFVAVVEYTADGDSYTAQKTSAAITVEIPPTQVYYGNCLWTPTLKALFVASDGNRDTLPSDWTDAVAKEFMTTTVSQVHLAKFAAVAGEYDSNTNAERMTEMDNDTPMQAAYIVPSTFTVHFTQNGANVDSSMVTQSVTVDGVNYTVYMWNGVSWDNVEQCKIYLS